MPNYQVIKIYNRLPYDVNYTFDQQSGCIKAHTVDMVVYDMACAAIKKSVIYMDAEDLDYVQHGVVPEADENFEKPLTEDEIYSIQDIPGWQMGVQNPEEYVTKSIQKGQMVSRQRKVADKVEVMASAE